MIMFSDRVFIALASDSKSNPDPKVAEKEKTEDDSLIGSFGRLRQRVVDYKSNQQQNKQLNVKQMNTSKHDKSVYGGIGMQRFCEYVQQLDANFNIEQNECANVKSSLEQSEKCQISTTERILYHIRGVSDMTGLPPYYGFVILTDYHLIFQGTALTTRTTCIKLNDTKLQVERAKIGGFLKRDTALKVVCDQGEFTWNVVNIKSVRRDQLFWSIWTMMKAHELSENVKKILTEHNNSNESDFTISDDLLMKIKRRLIVEAAEDVLRQNALQNVLEKEPKFDAVPFVRYATMSDKKKYVINLAKELIAIATKQNDSQSVMSSIFGGFTKSKQAKYIDPDNNIRLKKYNRLKKDFEREDKCKKLEEFKSRKREEFDIRDFFKYIKILRIELEPLMFAYRMFKCIVEWKNPGLSLLIFILLLLCAYCDYVHYLPAVALMANGCLLVSCKQNLEYTLLRCEAALIYAGFDAEDFDQEKLAAERYAAQYKNNQKNGKNGKKQWGIVNKIKMARYKFHLNKFSMGFHQKKLADISVFLGRFRTIYKWQEVHQSQIFCLCSIFLGVALIFIPLRYVFAVSVFGLFFKDNPWRSDKQKRKKGVIDRYLESIPPDIPEIDSDNEEEDDEESNEQGSEEEESFINRIRRRGKGSKNTSSEDTDN